MVFSGHCNKLCLPSRKWSRKENGSLAGDRSTSDHRITSKINDTPKGDYLSILKLHPILAEANILALNNISKICYCGQISLQSAAINCSFSEDQTPLRVPFILLAIVTTQSKLLKITCIIFTLFKISANIIIFMIVI